MKGFLSLTFLFNLAPMSTSAPFYKILYLTLNPHNASISFALLTPVSPSGEHGNPLTSQIQTTASSSQPRR
ncbi:uncharacterized protein BDV17DRAFT_261618 [Aspergillus undulatus]|uniref:uncharacterized protein n=1 Tax=Aspergillus undulatus TaxID=1810928 RepID=UPI003CCD6B67